MSDIRPGPVTRRLESYRLAALLVGPEMASIVAMNTKAQGDDAGLVRGHDVAAQSLGLLDAWAGVFHERVYGGTLPDLASLGQGIP